MTFYEFKLDHNTTEATKNFCCVKVEDIVEHGTVIRWFKKFSLDCKNLNNQAKSGWPKNTDSEAVHPVIVTNLALRGFQFELIIS